MIYSLLRPLLFLADAEDAHRISLAGLRILPVSLAPTPDPMLAQEIAGLKFDSPVGLAPGYDKDAEVMEAVLGLGFGFTEVGTLTPLPQSGNPRPRLFRLVEDKAVINRMGFNNRGQDDAAKRLARFRRSKPDATIGINIGANKDSADRIADYVAGVQAMAPYASYLTINISSPNTPGLRALQDKDALRDLLARVMAVRADETPVFLKVAPDLTPADIDDIVEVTMAERLSGLIVSNTTVSRPSLRSAYASETGGLSGAPLRDLAQQRLADFYKASGGSIPLIGVGGIANAEQAYARICAGASLVQLYSALVYEGPLLAAQINKGLVSLLKRDGFANIGQAVGSRRE